MPTIKLPQVNEYGATGAVAFDMVTPSGGIAVRGRSDAVPGSDGVGLQGISGGGVGVHGMAVVPGMNEEMPLPNAGVAIGVKGVAGEGGIGIYGAGGKLAGQFAGDVEVSGDLLLAGADCAEEFDVVAGATAQPGTVMVLTPNGNLKPSTHPYDRRVAGIVSGAGDYRPGMILDRRAGGERATVALVGKTYCLVDANDGEITVGDLLTTSATTGHAMKARDASQAFGAVLGKALGALRSGRGLLPVLVALQ